MEHEWKYIAHGDDTFSIKTLNDNFIAKVNEENIDIYIVQIHNLSLRSARGRW